MVLDALCTLYAALEQSKLQVQVVVVDNASTDSTVAAISAQYPQVHVIASAENLGFGRANNEGIRYLGFGKNSGQVRNEQEWYDDMQQVL